MNEPLLLQQEGLESVVVFRALQLGDMLCAVPALRALRGALPHARITLVGLPWAVQFADRFSRYIDDFVAFPGHPAFGEQPAEANVLPAFYRQMRERRFDLALQLHGNGKISNGIVSQFGARQAAGYALLDASAANDEFDPDFHLLPYPHIGAEPLRLLEFMTLLGADPLGDQLEFPLYVEDWRELQAAGLMKGLRPGEYICVHPGARFRDKCWPPQQFAAVADQLAREYGLTVVLTGSDKERDLTAAVMHHMQMPAVDAARPISIGAMAALMSRARLLVCNDTGVSHIAAGLGLASVVIFSKAELSRWAPLDRQRHRCIWDPTGIQPGEVLAAARLLLKPSFRQRAASSMR
ncbi:ADP-heptose--LPS heptosyltransferase [Novimethylophilus kurashikiensis]|uniref:ADP-heptose--LPS heptosyltransferase n=1 Tax=Novimethylophilus kurashikiensis TaxID=1825523 RepID=A0A2R5F382_9PROT|nr:glycosyltransferase family 9 protein [Novimethylophilus kurashikiensis]GBG12599.1 ADP-heptose--LPS heptosyltransferase [Novimethylophilus kurashikiensis]